MSPLKHFRGSLVAFALVMAPSAWAQCPNNNSVVGGVLTVACPGSINTPCIEGGEYVRLTVVNGSTYTFSTCGNNAFNTNITVKNANGNTNLAWNNDACGNQSSVTWTATYSGDVRVLMDRGNNCSTSNACTPINITCSGAPTNDDRCGAIVLTVGSGCTPLGTAPTNVGATATGSVPAPGCASYSGGDVWFSCVVPLSGMFTVSTLQVTNSPLYDTGLAVYTSSNNTCSGTFNLVAGSCNNDIDYPYNEMSSSTVSGLTPGTTAYIRVWANGNSQFGRFNICVTSVASDETCTAQLLTVGETCTYSSYSNAAATRTTNPSNSNATGCYWTNSSKDIWFKFQAPANGRVIIQTNAGTLTDGVMALYSNSNGNCATGNWSKMTCNDDGGPGDMPLLQRSGLTPNAMYWIRFWGYGGATGTFNLCVFSPTSAQLGDCSGSSPVCDAQPITNNSYTTGDATDLNSTNRGCLLDGEMQGSWIVYQASANGNLGFSITPTTSDDYDFAVWGPYSAGSNIQGLCSPAGPPLRCSYAQRSTTFNATGAYATGMGHANTAFNSPRFQPASTCTACSQDLNGNGWVPGIQVTAGEVYLLYVDNYDQSGTAFQLDWYMEDSQGQPSADLLNCFTLPVELIALDAAPSGDDVLVTWSTATEYNSDRFIVERSAENVRFLPIGTVHAMGESQTRSDYRLLDQFPLPGINYYRLAMMDQDGSLEHSPVVVAEMYEGGSTPILYPNPVKDRMHLGFNMSVPGDAMVLITDLVGRTVEIQHFHLDRGPGRVIVDAQRLKPGSYTVHILASSGPVGKAISFVKE